MYSIIVPVYNGKDVIDRCIQSIIKMSYSQWELIIVNDGSTDNTESICNKYLSDKRIKLITQENGGVSRARNRGLQEATGDYVLFVDADDYVEANICEVFDREMGDADFCIAGYVRHYPGGANSIAQTKNPIIPRTYNMEDFKRVFCELYRFGFIGSPWAKCYRRDKIRDFFNVNYCMGEDFIFNLSYLSQCNTIHVCFCPVYHYEVPDGGTLSSSVVRNGFDVLSAVYREGLQLISRLFAKYTQGKELITEKYMVDMMAMIERHIRYCQSFRYADMKTVIQQYKLSDIAEQCKTLLFGLKWETGRFLIGRKAYRTFWVYVKLSYFVSRVRNHVRNY